MKEKVKCLIGHTKDTTHDAYIKDNKWYVKCRGKEVRVKLELHDSSYSLTTVTSY